MGRAFEYRKDRKFKRWAAMSQAFTKIGREIAMAVKAGGADPETNSRLRLCIQNSRVANMPKATVDAAIKRATSKDEKDYEEIVYEGYGPHGIAVIVETATDNANRTVANLRMHFNKCNGALGNSGSVGFLFERKGEFKVAKGNLDTDMLELELIDFGCEDFQVDGDEIFIYVPFEEFGTMQKALDERKIEIVSASLQRFPSTTKALTPEQVEDVEKLLEKLDEDDDVQQVFHTME